MWRWTICVRLFPEKSEAEIQQIASDMWGHMARLAGEYLFLDQIFDFDPETKRGERIEVDGEPYFLRVASEQGPHIIFTGHLGNFELLPVAGLTFGMPVTSMFRPPNNRYIANYILSTRTKSMGGLLASRSGAAFELARILETGGNIGVLVDQKFTNGVPTTFFGRPCETSPLLPKLVRQFGCDVYPTRCKRLPGTRFPALYGRKADHPAHARRQGRCPGDGATAQRHGRALDPRRPRAMDVVSQTLEAERRVADEGGKGSLATPSTTPSPARPGSSA